MLDYNSIMKEIDDIKNCYFIYSYDHKLVLKFLDKLEKRVMVKDFRQFNYSSFKFDNNFNVEEFFEACNTIPMMQENRVVVLENALFLKRDYENKDMVDRIKTFLKNLPEYCIVIIFYVFQEQDKNKDNLNSFSDIGEICKIQELKGQDFYNEVSRIFENHGIGIKVSLLRYFCDRVINDFFHIENEISKLEAFLNGRELTKEDIDEVVSKSFEHNIFILINNVLENNLKQSLKIFKELINQGKELNYIFSMLSSQFSKFLDVRIMLQGNLDNNEIIKKTKMNPYVLNNFVRLSRKYSLNKLVNIIDGFLNIEYKLKSTSGIDIINELENYIISICTNNK